MIETKRNYRERERRSERGKEWEQENRERESKQKNIETITIHDQRIEHKFTMTHFSIEFQIKHNEMVLHFQHMISITPSHSLRAWMPLAFYSFFSIFFNYYYFPLNLTNQIGVCVYNCVVNTVLFFYEYSDKNIYSFGREIAIFFICLRFVYWVRCGFYRIIQGEWNQSTLFKDYLFTVIDTQHQIFFFFFSLFSL